MSDWSRRWEAARRLRVALFVVATALVLLARPASHHARAATLLVSFSDAEAKPALVEERIAIGALAARVYAPAGGGDLPGVVVVHGVHRLGIDEPRLERFSRALAASGVVVLTPEVKELRDYRVAPASIDTVGVAVRALAERTGRRHVGLMGMSFGGGIALLTAADPRFADAIGFVVAVGAHADLARVSRFFATDLVEEPSGASTPLRAHEYGATVLVYSHADQFFPPAEAAKAADALRLWLWEQKAEARAIAAELSPEVRAKVERLFAADVASMRGELLDAIGRLEGAMAEVSPRGRLDALRANVYLLHGAGDVVIPASETLWLAREVPPARLRAVLVSPAIQHVELKEPTARDKWELVHFMGMVLGEAEATPSR